MSCKNEKHLYEIRTRPGNNECADCGAPDPVWTSYQLGIFICVECSGIHRDLPEISRVKSVQLDYWKDEQIQLMKENGNLLAKMKYEANVPPFYYRPQPQDCPVLKEQWIRAKYQREEFTANKDISAWYLSGYKEGFLWKRGKDKKQFQSRKFVLSAEEGVLKYYMASDCRNPKSVISLGDLNAIFQPVKIGHRNGLAFIFTKDSRTRTIFVYHKNTEDIVDWFNCIRAARLRYLKKAFPDTPESELLPKITRNYVKEGYMEKTGPTRREAFKKRWFTLDSLERKLLYYKTPMDAYEQGGVFIGSTDHGYKVTDVLPDGLLRARNWREGISIETPERIFLLTCPHKNDQTEWMKALNDIISRPMTPQDYAAEASLRQNHKGSIRR